MSLKISFLRSLIEKGCRYSPRGTDPCSSTTRTSSRRQELPAKLIPFDPRVTTLKAQTLQEAVDEMMARISVLESSVLDNLANQV